MDELAKTILDYPIEEQLGKTNYKAHLSRATGQ